MLIRADRYLVWAGNRSPADAARVVAKLVGR
jgi:hypothetical protein